MEDYFLYSSNKLINPEPEAYLKCDKDQINPDKNYID